VPTTLSGQNPKIECRNPKQDHNDRNANAPNGAAPRLAFGHSNFFDLNLFRFSCFEFRI